MATIKCFNRDEKGRCLAYTEAECCKECPARITNIDKKIDMLREMLEKAKAKKLTRELQLELQMALLVRRGIREQKLSGWMSVYFEDLHRGSGGGQSESDSNRKTGLKQLMKDNRPVGVKPTKAQLEEYKEALAEWEDEHGKLEKLSKAQLSSSRMDSYLGLPICITDKESATCQGELTDKGELRALCKECPWLTL